MNKPTTPADNQPATMPVGSGVLLGIVAAIQKAIAEDKWLRPESWKNTGQALTVENNHLFRVPTHRGGKPATMPTATELCGVWEVISADMVNNE